MSPEIGSVEVKEPPKKGKDNTYPDYLDKEMTIRGILTTFCIAVVALVLDRVGSAGEHPTMFLNLWQKQASYILIGSIAVEAAGALFYKQRSAWARYYGQISLSIECPGINKISTGLVSGNGLVGHLGALPAGLRGACRGLRVLCLCTGNGSEVGIPRHALLGAHLDCRSLAAWQN